jgi:aldehyde:ferredoxin oxidoreductase
MTKHGYKGKMARINLGDRTVSVEHKDELFYRRYGGGRGVIAYHLLRELDQGIDPLGPENKLLFACGLLTGHSIPGAGRNSVGAKSPLTHAYGESEAGGYWGSELRRAGWDALIIEGRSDRPIYLWVDGDSIEFREAQHLWGSLTADCQEAIQEELGDNRVRIAQIGPGGERMVRYACIANDLHHFYGRTGMGAVMGSKNLKAIAVRGHSRLSVANKDKVRAITRWLGDVYRDVCEVFVTLGTGAGMDAMSYAGGLPTRNFTTGSFAQVDDISAEAVRDRIRIDMKGCYACPINCKKVVELKEPYEIDPRYGGPEYETLAALGSNCGVADLEAVAKANELCNAYSVDTISTGVAIGFAMECFERGLITEDQTDGVQLGFGNAEAMLTVTERICRREGFGHLLGEGVARAAKQIGHGAEAFAMHVKGQEIPMHEPRWKQGLGLGYAVSPTGADHCHSIHDTMYAVEGRSLDSLRPMGVLEPVPTTDLSPAKVRLFYYEHFWRGLNNVLGMCILLPYSHAQVVDLVAGVAGWDTSEWELVKISERALVLARLFNAREGFRRSDDRLPDRFYEPFLFEDVPLAGANVDRGEWERALTQYYEMMGWDADTGIPSESKLHELDIGWAL